MYVLCMSFMLCYVMLCHVCHVCHVMCEFYPIAANYTNLLESIKLVKESSIKCRVLRVWVKFIEERKEAKRSDLSLPQKSGPLSFSL